MAYSPQVNPYNRKVMSSVQYRPAQQGSQNPNVPWMSLLQNWNTLSNLYSGTGSAAGAGGAGAASAAGAGAPAGAAGAGVGGAGAAGAGAASAASSSGGSGAGAGGGMASMGPGLFAALIASGKLIEHGNPDSALGKGLLGGLGPSYAQIRADPKGMGIPTALGHAWATPWTSSRKARGTAPEWAGAMGK